MMRTKQITSDICGAPPANAWSPDVGPCSLNANGAYRRPSWPASIKLEVANCDLKWPNSATPGYETGGERPDEFGAFVRAEITKWGRVTKESKIKLE